MKTPTKNWAEEDSRQYIIKFLYRENLIYAGDDEIINCPKIFMVNAILTSCFQLAKEKKISKEKWIKSLRVIDNYIKGLVEITWKEGQFEVHEK